MKKLTIFISTLLILSVATMLILFNRSSYSNVETNKRNYIIVKTYRKTGYPFPMPFKKDAKIGDIALTMFGNFINLSIKKNNTSHWINVEDHYDLPVNEDITIKNTR